MYVHLLGDYSDLKGLFIASNPLLLFLSDRTVL